eukprot:7383010-Prymnesium_polylepis.2
MYPRFLVRGGVVQRVASGIRCPRDFCCYCASRRARPVLGSRTPSEALAPSPFRVRVVARRRTTRHSGACLATGEPWIRTHRQRCVASPD